MASARLAVAGAVLLTIVLWIAQRQSGSSAGGNLVIGIHMGAHDNTFVIMQGGQVLLVLELERVFGVRYFTKSEDRKLFEDQWRNVLEIAGKVIQPKGGTLVFDTAVQVHTNEKNLKEWMLPALKTIVTAQKWEERGHGMSHAVHGYYDSGFDKALIVVADADEDDGAFSVYWGQRGQVDLVEEVDLNIALAFEYAGAIMQEMNSGKPETRCWIDHPLHCNKYAGTLMGYAALGNATQAWKDKLLPLFLATPAQKKAELMAKFELPKDSEDQRNLAASAQRLLESLLLQKLEKHINLIKQGDGIVMMGDLGLNVRANTEVQRHFKRLVHVPCAPGDDGVGIGAGWQITPPKQHKQELMYMGLPVQDLEGLPALAAKYGARQVTAIEVAEILCNKKVIGVLRGRQEVGPRALVDRSLIAVPTDGEMKDKMNRIKDRQWFRPVAPTIAVDAVERMFADWNVVSPYMSFAPMLKPEYARKYPAIHHYDGTARPQTVSRHQNPWLHTMLMKIADKIGEPIIINTSFNTKGKPIINDAKEALALLRSLPDLDYILVEDTLFAKEAVMKSE